MNKHNSFLIKLFSTIFLFVVVVNSFAQKDLDSLITFGGGKYQIAVSNADKIPTNPVINDSTKKIPVGTYKINSQKIITNFAAEPITAAQMVGEPLTKLYNGLVKVGFGNYTTPYGEVWYNSLRSKEVAFGFRLKHLSSSPKFMDNANSGLFSKAAFDNNGYAGQSDNEISAYGKKFLKEHTLLGNFDYARNVVHYYGYDARMDTLTRDAIAQRFNMFSASAELVSHYTKEERYNHDIKLSYYNLMDLYKSSENNISANGFLKTSILGETLKINAAVDYYNYKTKIDTVNNTIVTLNPNFIATGEKYRAALGVTVAMDMFTQSKFYFYPNVELSYNIFEDIIIPYAGASGGLKKNSYKSFTDINPFVSSSLEMKNTDTKYEVFGGLRGTLSSKIAYSTRVSYSSISNMPLFVNDYDNISQSRFTVIYDNAELLNVKGEVSYQNSEKLRINLKGQYFNYKMQSELRAWYKPQVEISLGANYNLKDKIVAKVDLFYIDGQFAKTFVGEEGSPAGQTIVAKELKGQFDVNVGLEYRYNKKLGFFLNFNNVANMRYYRWMNYPTQRFGVMGGLSFSF